MQIYQYIPLSFQGKPPKDEAHISGVIEAIETFPHPKVDSDEDNNHVVVPESSTEGVGNITGKSVLIHRLFLDLNGQEYF